MKKHFIVGGRFKRTVHTKSNYKIIVFFTLLLCGIIFGVLLCAKGSSAWHLFFNNFVRDTLTTKISSSTFRNFCSIFMGLLVILIFDYICGLCGVGVAFLSFTPFLFGVYCGVITSQFYCLYKLSGIIYCTVINVPCYAIAAATYIKCCCYSWDMSRTIFSFLCDGRGGDRRERLLYNYTMQYLIMCVPIALSATINAIFFKLFFGLFGFI